MPLAGDRFRDANLITTHGVTIGTGVEHVWPWLVQMGQHRGGFYSYSWLENLVGCQIQNADQVRPDWQILNVGDKIPMHPRAESLIVAELKNAAHLVLVQHQPMFWSWSFNLLPLADQRCRLLVRTRIEWTGLSRWLLGPAIKTGHYVMERKMLTGIRTRAERLAQGPKPV